ncbi:hypothetical protein Mext_2294 [Methylorubrum extorquens PA1]|nr:hypothetical protein Mext_2294 [Methylorubrum extorquens PA1]
MPRFRRGKRRIGRHSAPRGGEARRLHPRLRGALHRDHGPQLGRAHRRFTLTVDKGRADALVSFCRQGVRKTGPTTFAWEARDYVSDSDLRVLLVSNAPAFLGDR